MRTSHRRPTETQRSVLSSYSWPCGHLTPRPAVTQRFVLSSNSWPCGHLTPRPAATQRFALSSNSWPCGHLWAGPTPPNPTHLFSIGTNTWPGGQLPCAAAGVETKFAATNIAANIRPAPRRKPNAAVFLPMAQPPCDESRTLRSVARSRSKACLMRYSFFAASMTTRCDRCGGLNMPARSRCRGVHSYSLLPIGYPTGRFGPVCRVPLADVTNGVIFSGIYSSPIGPGAVDVLSVAGVRRGQRRLNKKNVACHQSRLGASGVAHPPRLGRSDCPSARIGPQTQREQVGKTERCHDLEPVVTFQPDADSECAEVKRSKASAVEQSGPYASQNFASNQRCTRA